MRITVIATANYKEPVMTQISKVPCQYGAPMGRIARHNKPSTRTIRLYRVRLDSGGYDGGGTYWGIGTPLWHATDGNDYSEFIRAYDRTDAAVLLGIVGRLIMPVKL